MIPRPLLWSPVRFATKRTFVIRKSKWFGSGKRVCTRAVAASTQPQWFRYSFIYVEITIYFNSVRKFNDLFTITIIFVRRNNKRKRGFHWNFICIYIKNFDQYYVVKETRRGSRKRMREQDTRSRKFMISHISSTEIRRALGFWVLNAQWSKITPYSTQCNEGQGPPPGSIWLSFILMLN